MVFICLFIRACFRSCFSQSHLSVGRFSSIHCNFGWNLSPAVYSNSNFQPNWILPFEKFGSFTSTMYTVYSCTYYTQCVAISREIRRQFSFFNVVFISPLFSLHIAPRAVCAERNFPFPFCYLQRFVCVNRLITVIKFACSQPYIGTSFFFVRLFREFCYCLWFLSRARE